MASDLLADICLTGQMFERLDFDFVGLEFPSVGWRPLERCLEQHLQKNLDSDFVLTRQNLSERLHFCLNLLKIIKMTGGKNLPREPDVERLLRNFLSLPKYLLQPFQTT